MMAAGDFRVVELDIWCRYNFPDELKAGMVGYITASLKNVKDTNVGDTVTDAKNPVTSHCQVIRCYGLLWNVSYRWCKYD